MAQNDDRDDMILEARIVGTSVRTIAKRFAITSREVEAVIDRKLDCTLDNDLRMRVVKLDLARLDALGSCFFVKAIKDKDTQAGLLCCKLLERRAALLGLDSPTRIDVVQVSAPPPQQEFDRIFDAIVGIAASGPRGNGTTNSGSN
jgi:hypothetical protein